MALTAQTKNFEAIPGSMRVVGGTFTATGTSGDLKTGLTRTAFLYLQPTGGTPADQCTVNTVLPAVDPVTIGFTTGGISGNWLAVGW